VSKLRTKNRETTRGGKFCPQTGRKGRVGGWTVRKKRPGGRGAQSRHPKKKGRLSPFKKRGELKVAACTKRGMENGVKKHCGRKLRSIGN